MFPCLVNFKISTRERFILTPLDIALEHLNLLIHLRVSRSNVCIQSQLVKESMSAFLADMGKILRTLVLFLNVMAQG